WVATDALDGSSAILLWDVPTAKQIHKLTIRGARHIQPVAFAPDGRQVAAVGFDGGKEFVRAWDLATGQEGDTKSLSNPVSSDLLAFAPDGKRLLASFSSPSEGMFCWDLASGKLLWQVKDFTPSGLAFTPDGKVLSPMRQYLAVDLATGRRVQ